MTAKAPGNPKPKTNYLKIRATGAGCLTRRKTVTMPILKESPAYPRTSAMMT